MFHDKTKHDSADRSRLHVHEKYESEYWIKALDTLSDRLRELVARHDAMTTETRRAFGK